MKSVGKGNYRLSRVVSDCDACGQLVEGILSSGARGQVFICAPCHADVLCQALTSLAEVVQAERPPQVTQ